MLDGSAKRPYGTELVGSERKSGVSGPCPVPFAIPPLWPSVYNFVLSSCSSHLVVHINLGDDAVPFASYPLSHVNIDVAVSPSRCPPSIINIRVPFNCQLLRVYVDVLGAGLGLSSLFRVRFSLHSLIITRSSHPENLSSGKLNAVLIEFVGRWAIFCPPSRHSRHVLT